MNINDIDRVSKLTKDKSTLERFIKSKPYNDLPEISVRDAHGPDVKFQVRQFTLKTFLQGEVKEINKQLKSLGVTL
jgi:hypothetical protein